jgi:putative DNA primase/helicase
MIAWNYYEPGEHRVSCPICARGATDKTVGLTVKANGKGVCHCFRCGFASSNGSNKAPSFGKLTLPRIKGAPLAPKRKTLAAYARQTWAESQPLGGVAVDYLEARRCRIPPPDSDLRWHPSLRHPCGYEGPALLALITDAATSEPISLHQTWVSPDGQKAAIKNPRLFLGDGHRKQGGVIRLWSNEAITTGLGVAEGIETALSLAHGFAPVWSLMDAGNLAAFPYLPGIETLMIGADNDRAGLGAADECATRWAKCGAEVFVTQQAANDLNDVLREAA